MPLPIERIEVRILTIRGHRVLLDTDLAEMFGVPTKRLNEAVGRNMARFPEDFMFRLTSEESESLRSQIATSKGRGGRRYLPYAFTEQGVSMLSSVLNSERAIQVNIAIMRAFVALRRAAASHAALSRRLDELERKHGVHDEHLKIVFAAIRELMEPPKTPRRRIGF
ncbi:MAG: ORF6N domain-containing protein [Thermodesulfobacteriota bacterium]